MSNSSTDDTLSHRTPGTVRLAIARDIPDLVALRRQMFESMGRPADAGWEAVASDLFSRELLTGRLVAAVVDSPDGSDQLVASGVVMFELRLPSASSHATTKAYISSMSTYPKWRRRGFGSAILQRLIEVSEARGAHVIELRATEDGRPLYEAAGFDVDAGMPLLRRYLAASD